jgi:hypothetical protein
MKLVRTLRLKKREREVETASHAPIVFQCLRCKSILADSLTWSGVDELNDVIYLSSK